MTYYCHAGQVSINIGCGGSGHFIATYSHVNASCSSCTSKVSVTLSLCTKGSGTLLSIIHRIRMIEWGKGGEGGGGGKVSLEHCYHCEMFMILKNLVVQLGC
jgi:hypothetical protein